MSEIFGETTILVDRIFRTLGLSRLAKEDLISSENSKSLIYLKSYTDGNNSKI